MAEARLIRPIVSPEEWISSEFFLGPEVDAIRPYVKEFILEYCHSKDKRNFLCTGASRTGKSYGVRILLQRILYEMSCWENFPCLFNLSASTVPKIYWLSYTMNKAESTGLKGLIRMIDKSPYWQQPDLKRKPLESELVFPFCEVRTGSNVSHIIGEDTLGCILDEANVRKVAKGTEVEETQKMYQEMRQRSVMTYSNESGIWGGFSGIISSATTSSSFVALELERAKKNDDTVIMEASVYEANPKNFSKEKFPVFIGNGDIQPFIVDQIDSATTNLINETYGMTVKDFLETNPDLIEMVPVSIRKFYEEDLIFSLANMSGKVSYGNSKWLNKKYIANIWNEDKKPFNTTYIKIGIFDECDWELMLNEDYTMSDYHGENVYIHVDFGQKYDHTGFSALYYNTESHKICSMFSFEGIVDLDKPDNQTDQTKIWQLIMLLYNWGANIKLVTGDIWAKSYLIPQAKRWKESHPDSFTGEYYSVDTDDMTAYMTMYNYMKVSLYSIPYYDIMETELKELEKNVQTGKIDHMNNPNPSKPTHFKDLIDGFAGASFMLSIHDNISYEEILMQQGIERQQNKIKDDGFYSSIPLDEMPDPVDEIALFQHELYGEDSDYTLMSDLYD